MFAAAAATDFSFFIYTNSDGFDSGNLAMKLKRMEGNAILTKRFKRV